MHLNVVAEGVETEAQLDNLAALGCQEAQGYYFSRPIPADAILEYLLTERNID
jgi:EAL domain-containing protein (putative c-di-GMP-specific phosphodiesterase class I)